MKLEEICIQLCQGGVSAWCTDKPCIVDSAPDHVVVVAFQKETIIPVVVPESHAGIMGAPQWHYSSFEFDECRRGAQSVKQGKSDHY